MPKSSERIKREAKTLRRSLGISLTKIQNKLAVKEGFSNFKHLRAQEKANEIKKYRVQVIDGALLREPKESEPYFLFWWLQDTSLTFFSLWVGWRENGTEIRVPRQVNGIETKEFYENTRFYPELVIHNQDELMFWYLQKMGSALVAVDLAMKFAPFKEIITPSLPSDGAHLKVNENIYLSYKRKRELVDSCCSLKEMEMVDNQSSYLGV